MWNVRGFREVGGGVWSPSGKLKLGPPPSEQFIPRTPPPLPRKFFVLGPRICKAYNYFISNFFLIVREAPVHLLNLLYIALWYSSKKKNPPKNHSVQHVSRYSWPFEPGGINLLLINNILYCFEVEKTNFLMLISYQL